MVRNVFRLDGRQLGSLMVPRADVVCIDINQPRRESAPPDRIGAFALPVCDGGLDKLLGVIDAKQALALSAPGRMPDFGGDLHPAIHVPET